MHFTPKRYPRSSAQFLLNGVSLPFVSQYKYLGVILDEHITFKEAAANRLDQATEAFWSIQRALSSVPGDAYKKFFESLVAPLLDYCSPIWSHSLTRSSLERLQQHVYRCFLGVGRNHALAAAAGDLCWMANRPMLDGDLCWMANRPMLDGDLCWMANRPMLDGDLCWMANRRNIRTQPPGFQRNVFIRIFKEENP